ncbi:MAG TPA: NADH-quinone oxidoreductase subunit M [Planctomycetota bacterium]|nr:NADH-quinone oxidoreductase subunit M [Planctomycetota bacterium]
MSLLQSHVLSAILLTPMAAAVVLFLLPAARVQAIRAVGVGAALLTTLLAVWLFFAYDQAAAGFQFLERLAWVPSLGIAYQVGVDGISVAMVLLTAIVFLAGALVSCSVQSRVKDFYILLAALVSGVFGVFVSLDLFFFYFFYELAVVPMYLLIGYWGSGDKEYATMKLTLYLTAGAVVALIGLLLLYFSGLTPEPTFDLLALKAAVEAHGGLPLADQRLLFPILLVGFATIAPMWPLHSWSPIGHAAAPAAASMMHAGVLMKLGSYAIIRIAMTLLPQGAATWLPLVAVLCCFNIIYGGYVAMNQKDMKFVVGYSSSSHMGYVLLGIASISVLGTSGAVFLMFAHGIMTALAFALIGFFYDQTHTRMLGDLGGLMQKLPFVGVLFVMMAMASLGLPGFANFASELMVLVGSWERYPVATICGVFGLVIGATYLLRMVKTAWLGPLNPRWEGLRDARGLVECSPFLLLLGTLLLFGFYPLPIVDLIESGVTPIVQAVAAAELGLGG